MYQLINGHHIDNVQHVLRVHGIQHQYTGLENAQYLIRLLIRLFPLGHIVPVVGIQLLINIIIIIVTIATIVVLIIVVLVGDDGWNGRVVDN